MPHSNDRTLVTAAGDHEIRIFDLEHSGSVSAASSAASVASQGRRGSPRMHNGVNYLTDGNTNCRVYRSHGDRVKRIVTESSPHLFLTCSEDGEVRQWDLRQPSSAYPSPRGRIGSGDDRGIPPPLISYKRHNLDLNTISCSPSQPYYIALGGAHLHCFLHDRRMTGRDMALERGAGPARAGQKSDVEEETMGQATRCVRKFAPNGQPRMRRTDNGHITACKISDAHPNEMIVSWSGDHIYSFDLTRSPDASEDIQNLRSIAGSTNRNRVKESSDRKRKRRTGSQVSLLQEGTSRAESRQRTGVSASAREKGEMALRVQYQNGQTEDFPIESARRPASAASSLREAVLTDGQRKAYRLAKAVVELRKSMFTLDAQQPISETDVTGYTASFTSVLGHAASIYPDMAQISSDWRYPVDPSVEDIVFQRTLRSRRDSACRFVQAAGVIARAVGGRMQNASGETEPSHHFRAISFVPKEGPDLSAQEHFGYDFLKAIFLWLDSGVGALLEGFSCASPLARNASRLPVPKNSSIEAIDEILIPYLLGLASSCPIVNVDASRFEIDENRVLYGTEKEAVMAFAAALQVPFADLASAQSVQDTEVSGTRQTPLSRSNALYHWGLKVARGVLMNAGEGVNFDFTNSAFGGFGTGDSDTLQEEASVLERQEDIDPEEQEQAVQAFEIRSQVGAYSVSVEAEASGLDSESGSENDVIAMSELRAMMDSEEDDDNDDDEFEDVEGQDIFMTSAGPAIDGDSDDQDEDSDAQSHEAEDSSDDDGDDDGDDEEAAYGLPFYRNAFERRRLREKVQEMVPCTTHTRMYRGHCNVRTVKDVNFFGLDDEYVVSGSDDGNLFIWDRKSGELVNILEGDGEVVNVVQSHPYEPMLAVSGIDHTIKIFSPDSRAREAARLGRGVEVTDASGFSSISWPARMRGRRLPRQSTTTSEPAMARTSTSTEGRVEEEDDDIIAPNGLSSRKRMQQEYQIVGRNDVDRQGGNNEAYITVSLDRYMRTMTRRKLMICTAEHARDPCPTHSET